MQIRLPQPADLDAIRAQLKAGAHTAAFDALRGFVSTVDVLRLRIEAGLGLDRVDEALVDYERLARLGRQEDPAVLDSLTRAVLRGMLRSTDPLLAINACESLLGRDPDPCQKTLEQQADDANAAVASRVAALGALARRNVAGASSKLQKLAATATGPQRRAVIGVTSGLPAETAVPLLTAALASDDEGVQYAAASALGNFPTPQARAALEEYLAGAPAAMPRGAARLSLALHGSEEWIKQFLDVLPELQGDMLLAMGELLQKRDDPRGVEAITRVAKGDHEPLRIAAAARLPPSDETAGLVLEAALTNQNPWTRAAALQEFRPSSLLTLNRGRTFLRDPEPWVRLRAAQVVFARLTSSEQPSAVSHK
jgi:HEAT repeat protein